MKGKKVISVLLTVILIGATPDVFFHQLRADATSCYQQLYDGAYSSNLGEYAANIAGANLGRQMWSYYQQAWCADFACDCWRKVGVGTDIVPNEPSAPGLVTWFMNNNPSGVYYRQSGNSSYGTFKKGFYEPKKGDIVGICNGASGCLGKDGFGSGNRHCVDHIGIIYNVTDDKIITMEGNCGDPSKVKSYEYNWNNGASNGYGYTWNKKEAWIQYVCHPAYTDIVVTPPTNIWISLPNGPESSYLPNTEVDITFGADNATWYYGEMWRTYNGETSFYYSDTFSSGIWYASFALLGHYSCYIVAHNSAGFTTSEWIGWDIVDTKPTNLSISTDKSSYAVNSTVQFALSAENGYYKHIGIHKIINSEAPLYYEQDVAGSSCSVIITEPGYYCADFDAFNVCGTTSSDPVFFSVGSNYAIHFNGNGATSGSMSNQTFTYDVAQNLTANAFQRKYTVTYNYNGATGGNSASTATATATFNGWATSASGSKVYDDKQSVKNLATSGTVNLYANWTLGTVTLPTPTKSECTFLGWSTSSTAGIIDYAPGAQITPTEDITLYAAWSRAGYAPFWGDMNGDGVIDQQDQDIIYEIREGSRIPSAEQACFGDMNLDGKINGKDAVVVLFLIDGNDYTYENDAQITFIPPTKKVYKKGEVFNESGMAVEVVNKNNTDVCYTLTSNITVAGYDMNRIGTQTLTATFRGLVFTFNVTVQDDTYIVHFNGNGATSGSMSDQTFTYDEAQTLTANAFQRTYTVIYDYNGATGGNTETAAAATATFNGWATSANGEKVYNNQQSVSNLATGGTVNLYANWMLGTVTLPTPVRTGYSFGGWNTKADGTGTNYAAGTTYTPTADETLYAQWTTIGYTITLDPNGGVCGIARITAFYDEPYGVLPIPTREGYTFTGWYTADGTAVTESTVVTTAEDHTLYAHWEAQPQIVVPSGSTAVIDEETGFIYGLCLAPTEQTLNACYLSASGGATLRYRTGVFIGTGTQVDVLDEAGEVRQTYNIVIFGDTDGDGTVTQSDLAVLKAHINGAEEIAADDPRYLAGDTDGDGVITLMDISLMKGMMNGSVELDQATRKTT